MLQLADEVLFDFGEARDRKVLIANLSGVAVGETAAWTVSDEGRTFECFARRNGHFVLRKQFALDDFFPALPGGKEADLESLDIADGRLWISGSHCRVRREPSKSGVLNTDLRARRSRNLLGSIRLDTSGSLEPDSAAHLPFAGRTSLRRMLGDDPYLSAFRDLPSKENGLDIEGLAVLPRNLLLGLRGPVIDSHAVIVSLRRGAALPKDEGRPRLHMLDLGGLGVRDLCRHGDTVLILAGPVTATDGPFRIFRWRPSSRKTVETAQLAFEWALGPEHPEGICSFERNGRAGVLVVYDGPEKRRLTGTRVAADWLAEM